VHLSCQCQGHSGSHAPRQPPRITDQHLHYKWGLHATAIPPRPHPKTKLCAKVLQLPGQQLHCAHMLSKCARILSIVIHSLSPAASSKDFVPRAACAFFPSVAAVSDVFPSVAPVCAFFPSVAAVCAFFESVAGVCLPVLPAPSCPSAFFIAEGLSLPGARTLDAETAADCKLAEPACCCCCCCCESGGRAMGVEVTIIDVEVSCEGGLPCRRRGLAASPDCCCSGWRARSSLHSEA
jgi:hypothetical protein